MCDVSASVKRRMAFSPPYPTQERSRDEYGDGGSEGIAQCVVQTEAVLPVNEDEAGADGTHKDGGYETYDPAAALQSGRHVFGIAARTDVEPMADGEEGKGGQYLVEPADVEP